MSMRLTKLPNGDVEIYKAVQGEGSSLGEPCIFVRLHGCTLDCVWCDTDYSKKGAFIEMSYQEVADKIIELSGDKIDSVVFTGGEPLIQQEGIEKVIRILQETGKLFWFEIETNGTIKANDYLLQNLDAINCSPKLRSSMNPTEKRYKKEVLKFLAKSDIIDFKFVTDGGESEISEIKEIIKECGIEKDDITLMPKGDNSEDVLANTKKLVDIAINEGWKITTRLHILLFEKKRGV
jgi:organic radical activating enzyme